MNGNFVPIHQLLKTISFSEEPHSITIYICFESLSLCTNNVFPTNYAFHSFVPIQLIPDVTVSGNSLTQLQFN